MSFSQLLQTILQALKAGLAMATIPPLVTFLENTSKLDLTSVTGQLSYVAQLDLLRSTLTSSVIPLIPAEVAAINTMLSNELQAYLQQVLAKETAAPTVQPAPGTLRPATPPVAP